MRAPTSSYGCGTLSCEDCYGDAEWQAMSAQNYYENNPEQAIEDGYDIERGEYTDVIGLA